MVGTFCATLFSNFPYFNNSSMYLLDCDIGNSEDLFDGINCDF